MTVGTTRSAYLDRSWCYILHHAPSLFPHNKHRTLQSSLTSHPPSLHQQQLASSHTPTPLHSLPLHALLLTPQSLFPAPPSLQTSPNAQLLMQRTLSASTLALLMRVRLLHAPHPNPTDASDNALGPRTSLKMS
eukprot:3939063-Rhodomonas_salina.4